MNGPRNDMITSETEIRVRYAETDKMGFVYHGNYLTWFEVARVRLLDDMGCPYLQLEEEGYYLPVLQADLRYRKPLTFDDRVTVRVILRERPGLRISLEYEVVCRDEVHTTGNTLHAFIDQNGKPKKPPQSFLRAVAKHWPKQ